MDRTTVSVSVCAVTICLLTVCSQAQVTDQTTCPCPLIPVMPLTVPAPQTCYNDTFRYTCVQGYVRTAGTSNLIRCRRLNGSLQWTKASLVCKRDPRIEPQTTEGPVTVSSTGPQTQNKSILTTGPMGTEPEPTNSGQTSSGLNQTTTAVIVCVALIFLVVLGGIAFLFYKRRPSHTLVTTEETQIQMREVPAPQ